MKIILLFFCLFCCSVSFGQETSFKVLAVKGNVTFKVYGTDDLVKLKTGMSVNKSGEFRTGNGDYVALNHSTGKLYEITRSGVFKTDMIEKQLMNRKTIAGKYSAFIYDQLKNTSSGSSKSMQMLGAVVRARPDFLQVILPNTTNIMDEPLTVKWEKVQDSCTYFIRLFNEEGRTILMHSNDSSSFTINLSDLKLIHGKSYKLLVYCDGKSKAVSDTFCFKMAAKRLQNTVSDSIKTITADVKNPEMAIQKILCALIYHRNGFNIDAMTMFEEALVTAGDVDEFKNLYIRFLLDTGLSEFAHSKFLSKL